MIGKISVSFTWYTCKCSQRHSSWYLPGNQQHAICLMTLLHPQHHCINLLCKCKNRFYFPSCALATDSSLKQSWKSTNLQQLTGKNFLATYKFVLTIALMSKHRIPQRYGSHIHQNGKKYTMKIVWLNQDKKVELTEEMGCCCCLYCCFSSSSKYIFSATE